MTITRIYRTLTIHQPYAHLIVTPTAELPLGHIQKRVENRNWFCGYRGPLAIHAGKSTDRMPRGENPFGELPFGAIVGICELVACVDYRPGKRDRLPREHLWLADHRHAEGPWCFILERVRRLELPYFTRGAQGLWNCEIPEELLPD